MSARTPLEAFDSRYDRDGAANMTDAEWGDWLNRLPQDEFVAMCIAYGERPSVH